MKEKKAESIQEKKQVSTELDVKEKAGQTDKGSQASVKEEEKGGFLLGFLKKAIKPEGDKRKTTLKQEGTGKPIMTTSKGGTLVKKDTTIQQTGGTSGIEKDRTAETLAGIGETFLNDGLEKTRVGESGDWPWPKTYGSPLKVYKRTINKKLTIFLIENTAQMKQEEDMIAKIVNRRGKSGLACVINCGMHVMETEPFDIEWLREANLLLEDDMGDEVHLYDALAEIERLVTLYEGKQEETNTEKVVISEIEIIGIGTCKEKGSKVSKDFGIDCFSKVSKNPKIVTKYFGLTEASFLTAAEIGFRSIGSISQEYT